MVAGVNGGRSRGLYLWAREKEKRTDRSGGEREGLLGRQKGEEGIRAPVSEHNREVLGVNRAWKKEEIVKREGENIGAGMTQTKRYHKSSRGKGGERRRRKGFHQSRKR